MDLGEDFGIDCELKINRQQFNELCRPLLLRTISIIKTTLENAKTSADQINEVIGSYYLHLFFVVMAQKLCFFIENYTLFSAQKY